MEQSSGGQSIWVCLSPASGYTLVYNPFMDSKFIIGRDLESMFLVQSEGNSNTLSDYTPSNGVGYG
jgi:hypothetical protein